MHYRQFPDERLTGTRRGPPQAIELANDQRFPRELDLERYVPSWKCHVTTGNQRCRRVRCTPQARARCDSSATHCHALPSSVATLLPWRCGHLVCYAFSANRSLKKSNFLPGGGGKAHYAAQPNTAAALRSARSFLVRSVLPEAGGPAVPFCRKCIGRAHRRAHTRIAIGTCQCRVGALPPQCMRWAWPESQ